MKNYSLRNVIILVGGIPVKSQLVKDNPVEIEYDEEQYDLEMGADGEGTRVDNNNKAATVTLTFMSSSDANAFLSAIVLADGPDGAGIFPFALTDTKGTTKCIAKSAFLTGVPKSFAFSQKTTPRSWKIRTDKLESFVGGN